MDDIVDLMREWEMDFTVDSFGRGRVRYMQNGRTRDTIDLTEAEARVLAGEIEHNIQLIIRARQLVVEKRAQEGDDGSAT